MPTKSDIYNIRIEICQKCYQHYNHPSLILSKSYHHARKAQSQVINQTPNFIEEEQKYRKSFEQLVDYINQLETYFKNHHEEERDELNFTLMYSPSKQQKSPQAINPLIPCFNVIKNKPNKYLSKLPDTKLSTKRYLNTCTNKIVEFPKKDSFQIYFENLLVFSKLNIQKWPNVRLVSKIIKSLVQYCTQQGSLMANLKQFINDYLDIKSFQTLNISLYEYLVLTSNFEISQIEKEQNQDKIIESLGMIIDGRVKVLNIREHCEGKGLEDQQTVRKKDIMPYSLVGQKIKKSTIQGIYRGNQTKIDRLSQQKQSQQNKSVIKLKYTPVNNKEPQSTCTTLQRKPKTRPLSSNLLSLCKSPSFTAGLTTYRNQVFAMIKMGDIEENLFQQETKYQTSNHLDKALNKQIQKLCSINTSKPNIKSQSKITKRTKLFVNTQFNPVKMFRKTPFDESIVWTKFQKQNQHRNSRNSQNSKRSSKYTKIDEQQEIQHEKENHDNSMQRSSQRQQLKMSPSKKIKRASLFFNQRQSNILSQELKNLASSNKKNPGVNQNNQKSIQHSKGSLNPSRNSSNSRRSKTYKEDNSQFSDSDDSHSVYNRRSTEEMEDQMRKVSKLKVLQNHIAKKRSKDGSLRGKNSSSIDSKKSQDADSQRLQELEDEAKQKQDNENCHQNSMQLRSPTKLSVKSRRKSSFYYSTTKNNSLLDIINSSQRDTLQDEEDKKRDRKRSTRKMSRVNLAEEIKQFHNGVLPVPRIEEGIQCNIQQELLNQNFNHKSTENDVEIKSKLSKSGIRDSILTSKSSLAPDLLGNESKIIPKETPRETILTNNMRSGRASCFNTRISKFSFQNHHNLKDQLSQSREKDQDEMVAVFPENRFCHAFIVHKFVQKEFYEIEVKKMFTTSLSQKCELFEFDICCSELYRPYRIESVRKGFGQEERKFVLFPKIFQQVEKYSTPLVEVVNRLLKFHPISISRLFTNAHGISPLGQYCIWIYHRGINQFKPVFINDMIPFYEPDPQQMSFMQSRKPLVSVYAPLTNQNSIWFILLEKALAKVMGSYYALQQTSISDIFSMLTGCPVVNIEHITVKKLEKIFNQKIFSNKKAYVYSLKRNSVENMRIDRVVGMQINEKNHNMSVARVQQKQSSQIRMDLQSMIRKYQQICMVFFNMSFLFNQVQFPILEQNESQVSTLITFYLINQQVQQRNELYLCLGGFSKSNIKSKITIYLENQQQQDNSLKQLQLIDPLAYYNQKYIYQGEISKSGNYFFETEIKYGKYLCLVEAKYQPEQQYYVSTYSSKPITIHDVQHNYTEVETEVVDPLQKVIAAAKLRLRLKKERNSQSIKEEDLEAIVEYPHKIYAKNRNSIDDLMPYDFSDYKAQKKRKFKSSVSFGSIAPISSKWVIDKQFVQDEDWLKQKKQRQISGLIDHLKREQQKNQNEKLKKQLQTNQKDGVLKMMNRLGDSSNSQYMSNMENAKSRIEKKKKDKEKEKDNGKKIGWVMGADISKAIQTF